MRISVMILLISGISLISFYNKPDLIADKANKIKGIVFYDKTGNGCYEPGKDNPIEGIAVSNGREISISDRKGFYELPLRDNSVIFVIKPRNWMVPVDGNQLPLFYYNHSTTGATGTRYKGLSATGPVPESVDFPLYPVVEPDSFDIIVFGDTQVRNEQELYYVFHDVLHELIGTDAAFGVTLGDIVFDNLDMFDLVIKGIATVGIPWRYVLGNHDIDFTGTNNTDSRGAWYRTFGPSYYSFSYGPAHFIVLDNIRRYGIEKNPRDYRIGLGEDQVEFLKNEVNRLNPDQLLVLLAHSPWTDWLHSFRGTDSLSIWEDEAEKEVLYDLLAHHPNSVSLVGHTHLHYHNFIHSKDDFSGRKPHHMVSVGAVCGSWWRGAPDEYGIPHAMMWDGTPTSYALLHIDRNKWKLSWRAARRSAGFQMHIHAPEAVNSEKSKIKVIANIFNALPSAIVKMRIGNSGDWITMEKCRTIDPVRLAVVEREKRLGDVPWMPLIDRTAVSGHLWLAEPVIDLEPGVYPIHVKAVDEWWVYEGKRLLHVK